MYWISRRWTLISLFILALSAGWIAYTAASAPQSTQGRIPAPRPGFLAPDFELSALDGTTVRLSELAGKPVVINVWASWCPPCKAEMPAIESVWKEYRTKGLVVLAVNATNQDSLDAAASFVNQQGITFPVLLDLDGSTGRQYQVQALPSTYFISKDGTVMDVMVGGPMSEAYLRAQIEQLLEEQ